MLGNLARRCKIKSYRSSGKKQIVRDYFSCKLILITRHYVISFVSFRHVYIWTQSNNCSRCFKIDRTPMGWPDLYYFPRTPLFSIVRCCLSVAFVGLFLSAKCHGSSTSRVIHTYIHTYMRTVRSQHTFLQYYLGISDVQTSNG